MSDFQGKNAVAAIRVSTTKQGTDGDSPEAQKEQIERFAESKGITVKKFFVFMESASKEQQPMQEAIDYCKNKKNAVNLFIIKSIDRFTRGGSLSYDLLKNQLELHKVSLVDIYGVISATQVNTLDHLGVEYKWSVYSPSKKSEILEAERSKDELRDIMSRMIGAEVRYTRLGYWMRRPPYGYVSEKVDTIHGKRTILMPHPIESKLIVAAYEMRATKRYTDRQIAEKLNQMGYRGRSKRTFVRDASVPATTQRQTLMNDRHLWRLLRNPIYAGINMEKWTNYEPVKGMFDGLVSIELFNRANQGKRMIIEGSDKKYIVQDREAPEHLVNKGKRNTTFPYKKYVLCPECNKPLYGSASRGKSGKYYPAYHCDKRGHKFRVSKADLEACVDTFISGLQITPDRMEEVFKAIEISWERIRSEHEQKVVSLDIQIAQLKQEILATVSKLKVLQSETAIKYMEEDLVRMEAHIEELEAQKQSIKDNKLPELSAILSKARYFVEHLEELLVRQSDPLRKAQFFGVLFDKAPTYNDLLFRTPKTPLFTGVSPLFALASAENSHLVTPRRIELLLPG